MPGRITYAFKARVWVYAGPGGWHFVTLPKKLAAEITLFHGSMAKKFGSIAVTVAVKNCRWQTSVFRDTKSASYVLPLKAAVRKKTGIKEGEMLAATLEIG